MNLFYIDLASKQGSLACLSTDAVLAYSDVSSKLPDSQLLPLVEQVIKESELTYQDLTHVACVTGPGGFTSLRIAVTLANTLADQLNIPLAGVHLSDVYAARFELSDVLWLHSTKRIELFVRGFWAYANKWPDPTHITLDEFISLCPEEVQWAGELIPEHQEALASKFLIPAQLASKKESLIDLMSSLTYKQELIIPWYGRVG